MKIALIDLTDPRDLVCDKTIAGGMGTATRYGKGLFSNLLTRVKAQAIRMLPYNVAYVAAVLQHQGHEPMYRTELYPLNYDLAVVFSSIPSIEEDLLALRFLYEHGVPTVVVGTLAGVAPDRFEGATLVIKGEAEAFFTRPDWAEMLSKPAREVSPRALEVGWLADLDSLPFPDWSVFPHLESRYAIIDRERTVLPVVTSRGCPYPCGHYCPYPLGEGKSMRYRAIDKVVAELQYLETRFGVRAVKFRDPIFTLNRNRTYELMEAIKTSVPSLRWGCETHLAQLDEALLRQMAAAGCRMIQTGIESTYSPALQAAHRKTATQTHQEAMLKLAADLGIKVALYFILGLPGETLETMKASLDYAAELPAAFIQITACTPYPGTAFYEEVKDQLLTQDWRQFDQYHPVLGSEHYKPAALFELMSYGYRRFYLRPGWVRTIRSLRAHSAASAHA